MKNAKYTFHEDFSGAGMVRIGLGEEWECVRACDLSTKKCNAYRENFGDNHLYEGDISTTNIEEALPARLAWASFPCQDTSLAGVYAGLSGERSSMFWEWLKIVKGMATTDKAFDMVCLENVRGLLTSNSGRDFAAIGDSLAAAGYRFSAVIIDAVDFLPHSRGRLFIIGVRGNTNLPADITISKPDPRWHPESMIAASKLFSKKAKAQWFWLNLPEPDERKISLNQIISDSPIGVDWHSASQTAELVKMMSPENLKKLNVQKKSGKRVVGMLYKRMRDGVQRAEVRFDGVAGCLRTASGGSSRQTVVIVKGDEVRSRLISPREAANLMGLPSSYKLPNKYNDAYQLCGDGVAVPVVRFLAKNVFEPVLRSIDESIALKNIDVAA